MQLSAKQHSQTSLSSALSAYVCIRAPSALRNSFYRVILCIARTKLS